MGGSRCCDQPAATAWGSAAVCFAACRSFQTSSIISAPTRPYSRGRGGTTHPVAVEPGTRLHALVGDAVDVNTRHVQAVAEPGDGLVVSDLRKIYPPRFFGGAAVESVQCAAFGVPTGQVFGLLGANGAGKTTTVSMVCRAVEPTSGDAKVAGKSVLAVKSCVEINQ